VLIVGVVAAGALAATAVLGLGVLVDDLRTGEPMSVATLEMGGLGVLFAAAAVLLVRRMVRYLPVMTAIAALGGIAGGVQLMVSQAGETAQHRRDMAISECKHMLGEDAPAPSLSVCVPVAERCDREDRRVAAERHIILWVGVNPCIRDGFAAAGGETRHE
jgi:hypothetical protein